MLDIGTNDATNAPPGAVMHKEAGPNGVMIMVRVMFLVTCGVDLPFWSDQQCGIIPEPILQESEDGARVRVEIAVGALP